MANRYWVGGTGTWDASSTANWSDVSGGVSGASAPTSVDDVYFDNASSTSNFTVTLDSMFIGTGSISGTTLTITAVTKGSLSVGQKISFNISNVFAPDLNLANIVVQQILTGTGGVGTYRLNISTSVSSRQLFAGFSECQNRAVTTNSVLSFSGSSPTLIGGSIGDNALTAESGYTGIILLSSTSNNSVSINSGAYTVTISGSGSWTLDSALSVAIIYVYSGTLNSNDKSISIGTSFLAGSIGTKVINLGLSNIIVSSSYNVWNIPSTNTVFNASNSTLIFTTRVTHETAGFVTSGLVYGTVIYRPNYYGYYSAFAITGNLTAKDLIIESTGQIQVNVKVNKGSYDSSPVYVNLSGLFSFKGDSKSIRKMLVAYTSETAAYAKPTKIYITANSYDIDNADFRDTEITNTIISGTSLGDLGNNVGFVFTTPKTVYWKNTSTSSVGWRSASWVLSLSDTPSTDNYPLPQDSVVFVDAGIGASSSVGFFNSTDGIVPNIDFSQVTKPLTFNWIFNSAAGSFRALCGSFKVSESTTINATTNLTFINRKSSVIDTKNKSIGSSVTFNCENSVISVISPIAASGYVSLIRGTLELINTSISCSNFSSSSTLQRALNLGTSTVTLTGTGTVWDTSTATNLTLTSGTSNIVLSDDTTTARTFAGGGLVYNNLAINGATSTSTTTITGANTFNKLSSNKTVAHTIVFPNATTNIFEWAIRGYSGQLVTLSRTGASGTFTLNYNGSNNVTSDYLSISNAVGSGTKTWYVGPNSVNVGSNTGVTFQYGPVRYWVGGTGTWDASTTTNWAYLSGEAAGAVAPTSVDDVYFDSLSNATAYTATISSNVVATGSTSGSVLTITAVTSGTLAVGQRVYIPYSPDFGGMTSATIVSLGTGTGGIGTYNLSESLPAANSRTVYSGVTSCNNLYISGPVAGVVTLAGSRPLVIYGGVSFPVTGLTRTYSGELCFYSSNTGTIINTNGIIPTSNTMLAFTGTGTWILGSALTFASRLLVNRGGLFTNGYNLNGGSFLGWGSLTYGTGYINAGTSSITVADTIEINRTSNLNDFSAATFNFTSPYNTIFGQTLSTPIKNVNLLNSNYSVFYTYGSPLRITGTFYISPKSNVYGGSLGGNENVRIPITIDGTFSCVQPYGTYFRIAWNNLTVNGTFTAQNVNFERTNVTGTSAPVSGTNFGDCGNNTGVIFTPAKTVYWNLAGSRNWNAAGWALTSGGTPASVNFPLPQDTCIFDNAGAASTVTINGAHAIGNLDFSARTTEVTLASGTQTPNFYGNITLSSAVTLTGTGTWTFAGTGVQNITSAGKTYPMPINVNSRNTFKLVDAMTSTNYVALTTGTLSTDNNTITTPSFSSSNSNTRAINLGTSTVTLTGTGTVWDTSTKTNLTLDAANSTIVLQNAGDQTFAGGGLTYGKLKVKSP